ncbi:MAG: recombinase family protein [Chloroflexales bacterium]
MRIGYARVSTSDQNLHLQHDALQAAGCERLFSDTVSGARVDRPGLTAALNACREGDTLVVWKLDRLGRLLPHLVEIVQDLYAHGVGFTSVQEQMDTCGYDAARPTTTWTRASRAPPRIGISRER